MNSKPAPAEQPDHDAPRVELSRSMGLLQVTMIGIGAMIGAGIFVLTGLAAGVAGPGLILAFALNGVVTAITALAYAELGSSFPEAGGGYLWVKAALPQPSGFLSGWISWFAHAVACSLYAIAFGAFAVELLDLSGVGIDDLFGGRLFAGRCITVLVVLVFGWINLRGSKETGTAGLLVTLVKLAIIFLFLVFGIVAIFGGRTAVPWTDQFHDSLPNGASGVLLAMGLTFIAFEGYEIIAQCGEEVRDPERNIPRSIFLSLLVVVPVYVLVAFIAIGTAHDASRPDLPSWRVLGQNGELAMIEAADGFMPWGRVLFLIGGLFATMSALNATIYSSTRVAFAMGRDHNLPAAFASIHERYHTPRVSIYFSVALILAMAVLVPLHDVASATDAMFLLLFAMVNVAVLNLRKHERSAPRSFRVPLVPALPLLGVVVNLGIAAYLFALSPVGISIALAYIVVGVAVYLAYARRREHSETATPLVLEHAQAPPAARVTRHVLVSLTASSQPAPLLETGAILARHLQAELIVLRVLVIPAQLPLSQGRRLTQRGRASLEQLLREAPADLPLRLAVRVSHDIVPAIADTVKEYGIDLQILAPRTRRNRRWPPLGRELDDLLLDADCDTALVRGRPMSAQRVVVPVDTADEARLAVELATVFASEFGVDLMLLHVSDEPTESGTNERYADLLAAARSLLGEPRVSLVVQRGRDVSHWIRKTVEAGDLTVLTSGREGLLRRVALGNLALRLAGSLPGSVIVVRPAAGRIKSWFQELVGSRQP